MGLEFASPIDADKETVIEAVCVFLASNSKIFHVPPENRSSRQFDFDYNQGKVRDDGELSDIFIRIEEDQIYVRFFAGSHRDAEETVKRLSEALRTYGIVTQFDEP